MGRGDALDTLLAAAESDLQPLVARIIIDSLGRVWNSALHPRDRHGRFIETFAELRGGWLTSGGAERDTPLFGGRAIAGSRDGTSFLVQIQSALDEPGNPWLDRIGEIHSVPLNDLQTVEPIARIARKLNDTERIRFSQHVQSLSRIAPDAAAEIQAALDTQDRQEQMARLDKARDLLDAHPDMQVTPQIRDDIWNVMDDLGERPTEEEAGAEAARILRDHPPVGADDDVKAQIQENADSAVKALIQRRGFADYSYMQKAVQQMAHGAEQRGMVKDAQALRDLAIALDDAHNAPDAKARARAVEQARAAINQLPVRGQAHKRLRDDLDKLQRRDARIPFRKDSEPAPAPAPAPAPEPPKADIPEPPDVPNDRWNDAEEYDRRVAIEEAADARLAPDAAAPDGFAPERIYRGVRVDLPKDLADRVQRALEMPENIGDMGQHFDAGEAILDYLLSDKVESDYPGREKGLGIGAYWSTRREMAKAAQQQGGGGRLGVIVEGYYDPSAEVAGDPAFKKAENEITIGPNGHLRITGITVEGDATRNLLRDPVDVEGPNRVEPYTPQKAEIEPSAPKRPAFPDAIPAWGEGDPAEWHEGRFLNEGGNYVRERIPQPGDEIKIRRAANNRGFRYEVRVADPNAPKGLRTAHKWKKTMAEAVEEADRRYAALAKQRDEAAAAKAALPDAGDDPAPGDEVPDDQIPPLHEGGSRGATDKPRTVPEEKLPSAPRHTSTISEDDAQLLNRFYRGDDIDPAEVDRIENFLRDNGLVLSTDPDTGRVRRYVWEERNGYRFVRHVQDNEYFTPEQQDWMTSNLDRLLDVNPDWGQLPRPDIAWNAGHVTIDDRRGRAPRTNNPDVYADMGVDPMTGRPRLRVRPELFDDEWLSRTGDNGFLGNTPNFLIGRAPGLSPEQRRLNILAHEIGHYLDRHTAVARPEVNQLARAFANERKNGIPRWRGDGLALTPGGEARSRYAQTSIEEWIAEAYADVVTNGENASWASRELVRLLTGRVQDKEITPPRSAPTPGPIPAPEPRRDIDIRDLADVYRAINEVLGDDADLDPEARDYWLDVRTAIRARDFQRAIERLDDIEGIDGYEGIPANIRESLERLDLIQKGQDVLFESEPRRDPLERFEPPGMNNDFAKFLRDDVDERADFNANVEDIRAIADDRRLNGDAADMIRAALKRLDSEHYHTGIGALDDMVNDDMFEDVREALADADLFGAFKGDVYGLTQQWKRAFPAEAPADDFEVGDRVLLDLGDGPLPVVVQNKRPATSGDVDDWEFRDDAGNVYAIPIKRGLVNDIVRRPDSGDEPSGRAPDVPATSGDNEFRDLDNAYIAKVFDNDRVKNRWYTFIDAVAEALDNDEIVLSDDVEAVLNDVRKMLADDKRGEAFDRFARGINPGDVDEQLYNDFARAYADYGGPKRMQWIRDAQNVQVGDLVRLDGDDGDYEVVDVSETGSGDLGPAGVMVLVRRVDDGSEVNVFIGDPADWDLNFTRPPAPSGDGGDVVDPEPDAPEPDLSKDPGPPAPPDADAVPDDPFWKFPRLRGLMERAKRGLGVGNLADRYGVDRDGNVVFAQDAVVIPGAVRGRKPKGNRPRRPAADGFIVRIEAPKDAIDGQPFEGEFAVVAVYDEAYVDMDHPRVPGLKNNDPVYYFDHVPVKDLVKIPPDDARARALVDQFGEDLARRFAGRNAGRIAPLFGRVKPIIDRIAAHENILDRVLLDRNGNPFAAGDIVRYDGKRHLVVRLNLPWDNGGKPRVVLQPLEGAVGGRREPLANEVEFFTEAKEAKDVNLEFGGNVPADLDSLRSKIFNLRGGLKLHGKPGEAPIDWGQKILDAVDSGDLDAITSALLEDENGSVAAFMEAAENFLNRMRAKILEANRRGDPDYMDVGDEEQMNRVLENYLLMRAALTGLWASGSGDKRRVARRRIAGHDYAGNRPIVKFRSAWNELRDKFDAARAGMPGDPVMDDADILIRHIGRMNLDDDDEYARAAAGLRTLMRVLPRTDLQDLARQAFVHMSDWADDRDLRRMARRGGPGAPDKFRPEVRTPRPDVVDLEPPPAGSGMYDRLEPDDIAFIRLRLGALARALGENSDDFFADVRDKMDVGERLSDDEMEKIARAIEARIPDVRNSVARRRHQEILDRMRGGRPAAPAAAPAAPPRPRPDAEVIDLPAEDMAFLDQKVRLKILERAIADPDRAERIRRVMDGLRAKTPIRGSDLDAMRRALEFRRDKHIGLGNFDKADQYQAVLDHLGVGRIRPGAKPAAKAPEPVERPRLNRDEAAAKMDAILDEEHKRLRAAKDRDAARVIRARQDDIADALNNAGDAFDDDPADVARRNSHLDVAADAIRGVPETSVRDELEKILSDHKRYYAAKDFEVIVDRYLSDAESNNQDAALDKAARDRYLAGAQAHLDRFGDMWPDLRDGVQKKIDDLRAKFESDDKRRVPPVGRTAARDELDDVVDAREEELRKAGRRADAAGLVDAADDIAAALDRAEEAHKAGNKADRDLALDEARDALPRLRAIDTDIAEKAERAIEGNAARFHAADNRPAFVVGGAWKIEPGDVRMDLAIPASTGAGSVEEAANVFFGVDTNTLMQMGKGRGVPPGYTIVSAKSQGAGGSVGETHFVTHTATGKRFVIKSDNVSPLGLEAEEDVAILYRALGLPQPRVYRLRMQNDGLDTIIMDWAGSEQQITNVGMVGGPLRLGHWNPLDRMDPLRMALSNAIIGQTDRHGGNLMAGVVRGRHRTPVFIDNGLALFNGGHRSVPQPATDRTNVKAPWEFSPADILFKKNGAHRVSWNVNSLLSAAQETAQGMSDDEVRETLTEWATRMRDEAIKRQAEFRNTATARFVAARAQWVLDHMDEIVYDFKNAVVSPW